MKRGMRPSEGLRRAYQRLAASFTGSPLTLPQASILRALMENGPLNQTEIGDISGLDRSTRGEMLKRMATLGLVVSVRMDTDKRATLISMTPKGRAQLLKADRSLFSAEADVMRMVPAADRACFVRCLQAIAEAE